MINYLKLRMHNKSYYLINNNWSQVNTQQQLISYKQGQIDTVQSLLNYQQGQICSLVPVAGEMKLMV